MPHERWNHRSESLNALDLAVRQVTHGLIDELSIDLTDEGCVVIRCLSRSYYGVQLAARAARQFSAEHLLRYDVRLLVHVGGSSLELVIRAAEHDDIDRTLSTPVAECRSQLTISPSAGSREVAGIVVLEC